MSVNWQHSSEIGDICWIKFPTSQFSMFLELHENLLNPFNDFMKDKPLISEEW